MTLIDLSHEIADGTITYPGLPGPVIGDHLSWDASHSVYAEGVEFQIGRIEMIANTGTYLDTPAHRWREGYDLSGLSLDAVANVPGVVVDGDAQSIEPDVFDGVEVAGRAVIFRTGWSRHWTTDKYGAPDHPFVSEAAAQRLIDGGVKVVGIDSVNIDDTGPESKGRRPIHSAFLKAGVPIVEHLTNLESLPDDGFRFFAVPPKVRGMATFPVRAFAVVE
jgi:arylformamidase